jgi:hypothetical protein
MQAVLSITPAYTFYEKIKIIYKIMSCLADSKSKICIKIFILIYQTEKFAYGYRKR